MCSAFFRISDFGCNASRSGTSEQMDFPTTKSDRSQIFPSKAFSVRDLKGASICLGAPPHRQGRKGLLYRSAFYLRALLVRKSGLKRWQTQEGTDLDSLKVQLRST